MATLSEQALGDPLSMHLRDDVTTLNCHWTVGEALASLRSPDLPEKIIYLYVIDNERRLLGVVPTRRLLMSEPHIKVDDIMVKNVISIPQTMTVLDACEFFVMHRLLAFPVVDQENHLLGVVDVSLFTDEMFDVSQQQSNHDLFQMIGIRLAQTRHCSPWAGFKGRFPWLLCNIGGGIICAFIVGMYEHSMRELMVILALFIPVVLTLAEAVSMQSMSIALQNFREEKIGWRTLFQPLRMEFLTSAMLGAGSGIIVASICMIWKREFKVALAIMIAITLAVVTACLLGVLLPALVKLFKGDPKIAAGPVVLASADIATLLFYFSMAGAILG